MAARRTQFESENQRVYLTGASITTNKDRKRFEASCVPTEDRKDRAHAKVDPDGWLVSGSAVPTAKPRRYLAAMMVAVKIGRRTVRVGPDTHAETIGDRAAYLASQGVPVGYVGSITGAQNAKGRAVGVSYRDVEAFAARIGKTVKDVLRPVTRQAMTREEAELNRQANAILKGARRK